MSTENQLDPQSPVTLTLTVEKVNYILNALQERPYGQVAGLIQEIMTKAKESLESSIDASISSDAPAVSSAAH